MSPRRKGSEVGDQAALGNRLRETREYLGLSQQFVSKQTGLARSAISDIERGVRKVDSLELKKLSQLYRFPVSYFLGDTSAAEAAGDETLHALTRAASELAEQDRQQILRFAMFLRHYGPNRRSTEGADDLG